MSGDSLAIEKMPRVPTHADVQPRIVCWRRPEVREVRSFDRKVVVVENRRSAHKRIGDPSERKGVQRKRAEILDDDEVGTVESLTNRAP